MWKYHITSWDLWFHVFRIDTEDNFWTREWLQNDTYTLNKNYAKIFYNIDSALSALQIAKAKWKKEISTTSIKKSEYEELKEKISWSEL